MIMTDTDRLNFLMQFLSYDDVGDEDYVPGVVVRWEDMEEAFSLGPKTDGTAEYVCNPTDSMRTTIDRAIINHGRLA